MEPLDYAKSEDRFVRRFPFYFALVVFLVGVFYLGAVTFLQVPEENQRVVDAISGFVMGVMLSPIISYFFSSSHKSHTRNMNDNKVETTP